MGEGKVFYKGKRIKAIEAFKKTGLSPVNLGPKDGLAIVGTNAMAIGFSVLVLQKINNIIKLADLVYALSLEGFKGNTSPLHEKVNAERPYDGQLISTKRVRSFLSNSYLWKSSIDSLQDPLSYRSACHVHGAVLDSLKFAKHQLKIQLNSSEDNPCVLPEEDDIIHSGNFEPLAWVLPLEMLLIGLSHLSRISCSRTIKLSTPAFTKLSRFLTPSEGQTIAYGTIQKTFTSLDTEIRHLSNPCSVDYQSISGNIEDHSTNAPYIIEKMNKVIDNLYYILAMEAMHAAQAIDLRNVVNKIGITTCKFYHLIRNEIPFLEKDRVLTTDIKKAYNVVKSKQLLEIINPN